MFLFSNLTSLPVQMLLFGGGGGTVYFGYSCTIKHWRLCSCRRWSACLEQSSSRSAPIPGHFPLSKRTWSHICSTLSFPPVWLYHWLFFVQSPWSRLCCLCLYKFVIVTLHYITEGRKVAAVVLVTISVMVTMKQVCLQCLAKGIRRHTLCPPSKSMASPQKKKLQFVPMLWTESWAVAAALSCWPCAVMLADISLVSK